MDQFISRQKSLLLREELQTAEVSNKSNHIHEKLIETGPFKSSTGIFTYFGVNNEVETKALIEFALGEGKRVAVPKCFGKGLMRFYAINSIGELKLSSLGLWEPFLLEHEALPDLNTLLIVPGVVFDKKLNRMGFGMGYYDRYLASHTYDKAIALAYTCQVLSEIPTQPWDVKMDAIITEDHVYGQLIST